MSHLARQITFHNKSYDIPVTIVDRIVNYFDPVSGAERWRQRARMAISGGYTGADRSRRANVLGSRRETDADGAILPDLSTLREEAQHLCRNNPIAGGAVKTNVTKVVGSGLKAKSQIDRTVLGLDDDQADKWERAAEREYRLATESREIDAERQLPFSLLQGLAFLKSLEDGDVFVNLPRFSRSGSPYKLKLQLIEGARVSNPDNKQDSDFLAGGIRRDKNGAAEIFYVSNRHPGTRRLRGAPLSWTPIKAFSSNGDPLVLHLYDKQRPGQSRGVPYLAPVVELIKQLGRYTDAEVMAAVVTGMLTVFVTNETGSPTLGPAPTPANPDADASQQVDTTGMELGYGSVIGLLPNEKIETVNPARPNTAFDPFVMSILRQIGMALELPYEILIKHFTASYSASRAALEEAWDYFSRRRHWLAVMLCQPVYEAIIAEAVATGRLAAPGFFSDPIRRRAWLSTSWTGDAPNQIDPLKEINAAARRVELTVSTLDEESRKLTGSAWEDKLPQIIKERAILRANGITISAYEQAAADPGPDENKKEDEQNATD